jgi:insulysin
MKIKNLCLISLFAIGFCFHTPLIAKEALGYKVIEDKALLPVKTPTLKDRKIVKIRLDNGLEAVLISDPKTDQSGAALAVEAGSWQDPVEYPGIAHFLEHMLFLGTKQFPNESEYQGYISEHGGMTNAFTTNTYTAYMFSIDNDSIKGGLERFSSFFKDPLFNPSGVERELNAIDQEYAKNYENDDIREITILKELENKKHPNNRFAMGNSATLGAVSQETLKQWYKDHYSANLMHLYFLSNLSIDEMISLVVKDFGEIVNSNKSVFETEEKIQNPEMEGKLVYIDPIKDVRTLTIFWELPPEFNEMRETRPDKLICHILGHEGKESLLALLKKEQLGEELACSSINIGGKNLLMIIEVKLTDDGLKQINKVVLRIFQTLALLKEKGYPSYLFDEVHQMGIIDYEYKKKEDTFDEVTNSADLLINENIETFPEENSIVKKFNQENMQALLKYMTPEHARFLIKAPSQLSGIKPDLKEKWLSVAYSIVPVSSEVLKEWDHAKAIPEITLPEKNQFIPTSLQQLVSMAAKEKLSLIPQPEVLLNNEKGVIYYAADDRYNTPNIYLYLNLKTPAIDKGDPLKSAIADIYIKGVEEDLNKFSYPASIAGLKFSVDQSSEGVNFLVTGYSDNAHLLFEEIVKVLKDPKITEEHFNLYKQTQLREYQNFNKETPLSRASEVLKDVIFKNFSTNHQKEEALGRLTYEQFEKSVKDMFAQVYLEGLLFGNVTKEQAKGYTEQLTQHFNGIVYPKQDQKKNLVITLPNNQGPFFFEKQIPAQGNAALLAIENPEYSFKNRAAQQILMQAIYEPFFSTLRTKQQTGYIVYSTGQEEERKLFNLFAVQSNTHDPRDLLARFELFIETFLQEFGTTYLSKENFETIRASLLLELLKPQNNLDEMGSLLKTLAFKYDGEFKWMDHRVNGMKNLTYEEFVEFSKNFLGKTNKRRLGVLIKGQTDARVVDYSQIKTIDQLKQQSSFSIGDLPK